MAVQSLKPRIDLIKARYGEDKDKISKETSVLYEQAGVNPLAGERRTGKGHHPRGAHPPPQGPLRAAQRSRGTHTADPPPPPVRCRL